jgi:hypothetical protein
MLAGCYRAGAPEFTSNSQKEGSVPPPLENQPGAGNPGGESSSGRQAENNDYLGGVRGDWTKFELEHVSLGLWASVGEFAPSPHYETMPWAAYKIEIAEDEARWATTAPSGGIFTGSTVAVASNGSDVAMIVSGVAKLDFSVQKLDLEFADFYKFSFANITSEGGAISYNGPVAVIRTGENISGITFSSGETVGNLSGQLYGIDSGNPTEAAGRVSVSSGLSRLEGVWGVKR